MDNECDCACVCVGRVWVGAIQEDADLETMGTSDRRTSCQPMEMAHLSLCVCLCPVQIKILHIYHRCDESSLTEKQKFSFWT